MNRENTEAIQVATMKALAAQIERVLSVARIKGWEFPTTACDVGVTVVAATAIATKVKVRMDDVHREEFISSTNTANDIIKIADDLVTEWLAFHATAKPSKRRSNG